MNPALPADPRNLKGLLSREQVASLSTVYAAQTVLGIPLYDTVTIANGNAEKQINFFTHTKQNDGEAVTNMEDSGKLISGKIQVVTEITLDVSPPNGVRSKSFLDDAELLTHNIARFQLKINGAVVAEGKVKELIGGGLQGFGTPLVGNAAAGDPKPYATPRVGASRGFVLEPAVVIPTNVGFEMNFLYKAAPNPTANVDLSLAFRGKHIRLSNG